MSSGMNESSGPKTQESPMDGTPQCVINVDILIYICTDFVPGKPRTFHMNFYGRTPLVETYRQIDSSYKV